MFLGGINFKEFLSTYEEWHTLVIGFCEGFCPWRIRYKIPNNLKEQAEAEYHYYVSGRVIGFMALVGFVLVIIGVLR